MSIFLCSLQGCGEFVFFTVIVITVFFFFNRNAPEYGEVAKN